MNDSWLFPVPAGVTSSGLMRASLTRINQCLLRSRPRPRLGTGITRGPSRSARMTLGSRLSVWACGVSVRHRAQRKCRVRYRTYARSSTRHNSFYCSCRPCTFLTPAVQLSAPKARRSRGSPRPQAATPAGDCHSNSISEIRPACTARSAQQTANRALWPRIAVATCG